jgi:hypothetical protein
MEISSRLFGRLSINWTPPRRLAPATPESMNSTITPARTDRNVHVCPILLDTNVQCLKIEFSAPGNGSRIEARYSQL